MINFNKNNIYEETILNGATPVLKDKLVPVTIDEEGNVYKADITSDWYSYEDKRWANAVILEDGVSEPQPGEKIEENQIESYFVWIPKYSYQLWDLGNYSSLTKIDSSKPHAIQIRFGLTNTTNEKDDECTTPMNADKTQSLSGEKGSCSEGKWMTHPAFISFGVNGLWIGKFETGYKGAKSTNEAQQNTTDTNQIVIKPNVYSWRSITLGSAFDVSYKYKREELDSHLMKNTEWGAVAYLTNSQYGRCTNNSCEEIRINNNDTYITGYAATVAPTKEYSSTSIEGNRYEQTTLGVDGTYTLNYKNSKANIASTTGNKTGIYDMSGGAWEYVMGYNKNASTLGGQSELTNIYKDFFENSKYNKYYDIYLSTKGTDYNKRILGDATGEIGPFESDKSSWYKDSAIFSTSSNLWFFRGDSRSSGIIAGIFAFDSFPGIKSTNITFRIVLSPKES